MITKGENIVTVLLAIAVKPHPETGLIPYILMGSDSLKINTNNELSNQSRDEDAKKIFRVNDKLISMSGRIDTNFYDGIIEFIRQNDCEITDLSNLVLTHIKHHMSENERYEDARFAVYIGSCINATPKLAFIEVEKNNLENHKLTIMEPPINGFVPGFAGSISVPQDDDLSYAFIERVRNNCDNLNLTCVKRAAKDYLEKAAERYPERCNQNIKFEIIR